MNLDKIKKNILDLKDKLLRKSSDDQDEYEDESEYDDDSTAIDSQLNQSLKKDEESGDDTFFMNSKVKNKSLSLKDDDKTPTFNLSNIKNKPQKSDDSNQNDEDNEEEYENKFDEIKYKISDFFDSLKSDKEKFRKTILYSFLFIGITYVMWDDIFPPEKSHRTIVRKVRRTSRKSVKRNKIKTRGKVRGNKKILKKSLFVVEKKTEEKTINIIKDNLNNKNKTISDVSDLPKSITAAPSENEKIKMVESDKNDFNLEDKIPNQKNEDNLSNAIDKVQYKNIENTSKSKITLGEDTFSDSKDTDHKINLIDKISEKVNVIEDEYISPPSYKKIGRGLVYNCTGGHWACVDKFSYFKCYENQKWNKLKYRKPECVNQKVYKNKSDCRKIHAYFVNMNAKTHFCKKPDPPENKE